MMPRSEEEGRAWAAISSLDDNLLKRLLRFAPVFTGVMLVLAVVLGVVITLVEGPIGGWGWFFLLLGIVGWSSLAFVSKSVRRRGADYLFDEEHQEPLKLLSATERNEYRAFSWTAVGIAATMAVVLLLAVFLHSTGGLSLGVPAWLAISAGCLLAVCMVLLFVQRTRRLVRKLTTKLADEHASAPARET